IVLPVAKHLAQSEIGDTAWNEIEARVDSAVGALTLLTESLGESAAAGEKEAAIGDDPRLQNAGSVLRHLHKILQALDPGFGGLVKVRNNRWEPLWVHRRFSQIYTPKPPVVLP